MPSPDQKITHTPGPWALNPLSAAVDAFDTGDPLPICKMLWPTGLRSEAQTEANATLIAAAPDMLEALLDAKKRLQGAGMLGATNDPVSAAIAKAEGR